MVGCDYEDVLLLDLHVHKPLRDRPSPSAANHASKPSGTCISCFDQITVFVCNMKRLGYLTGTSAMCRSDFDLAGGQVKSSRTIFIFIVKNDLHRIGVPKECVV